MFIKKNSTRDFWLELFDYSEYLKKKWQIWQEFKIQFRGTKEETEVIDSLDEEYYYSLSWRLIQKNCYKT